jgi:hypothetical protein
MGANKITYYGKVLIDLTSDTVTPETLAEGVTAHDKSGAKITGTMPIPTLETWVFEMEDGTTVEKAVNVNA